MIYFVYFADMEDSAMQGCNMSAISVLQEAVRNVLPFILSVRSCLLEIKAITPGVWGRAPVLLFLIRRMYWEWINSRLQILIVFSW